MLTKSKVKKYWRDRVDEHGGRAVGFDNLPMGVLEAEDRVRKEFIFTRCPKNLKTLDYGCGIGKYAEDFESYSGVDITWKLIEIARQEHLGKMFFVLDDIKLSETSMTFELFFTATVLQHNPDDVVLDIIESVKNARPSNLMFSLYEIADVQAPHVRGRDAEAYVEMVSKFFDIED